MTDYSVYKTDKREKTALLVVSIIATAFIGELFYGSMIAVVLTPFTYRILSGYYVRYAISKRSESLRRGFRDLLASLSASFAAGRHMGDALSESEKELLSIYDPDDEIMVELRGMVTRISGGETDIDVLSDFDRRASLEEVSLFVQVFRASRETGGDIVGSMLKASDMLSDKLKIEEEIKKMTSQKRVEGVVISLMPVMILLFLRIVAPDYVSMLYGNLLGIVIMTASIALIVYAFILIQKITEIRV